MKKENKKENWIWMPHAGHLIVGNYCRFHLNTKVGKYIVSTVGEYVPDSQVQEIYNQTRKLNLTGRGDARETDFLKKNGFEEIGFNRTYETMVFKAKKSKNKCCPFEMISGDVDMSGYSNAADAYSGHLKLCKKWNKKSS